MLTIDDLRGEFDPSWGWKPNPNIEFTPAARQHAFSQYAELVKERYLENGDYALSKKQAANMMKKSWGITSINGKDVVTQYPPERAPAYAGIENVGDKFAEHAIAAIKERTGKDVTRDGLKLRLIPGQTPEQYKSGKTPQYYLMWSDPKTGLDEFSPWAFEVDPKALRERQTEERKAALEAAIGKDNLLGVPLKAATSVPPHRRTNAQRELIKSAAAGPASTDAAIDTASVEPFDRVSESEKSRGLPDLSLFTDLPPHRRKRPAPSTALAGSTSEGGGL